MSKSTLSGSAWHVPNDTEPRSAVAGASSGAVLGAIEQAAAEDAVKRAYDSMPPLRSRVCDGEDA